MANELFTGQTTGQTVFSILVSGSGQFYRYDSHTWESFSGPNWASYRIPMAESPGTGLYLASLPPSVSSPAVYRLAFYAQSASGNTAASGDSLLSSHALDLSESGVASLGLVQSITDKFLFDGSSNVLATGTGGGSTGPTAVQIRQEIDANSTQLTALVTGQSSILTAIAGIPLAVWNVLKSVTFTTNSLGSKIAAFLNALGSDSRPLVSADSHTGGVTVAGITGGVTLSPSDPTLTRIAGLLGENSGIRNASVVGGRLLSYDLCLYDTTAHAALNDGTTGLVHKYSLSMTYDSNGNQITVTSVRSS